MPRTCFEKTELISSTASASLSYKTATFFKTTFSLDGFRSNVVRPKSSVISKDLQKLYPNQQRLKCFTHLKFSVKQVNLKETQETLKINCHETNK